jgi:AcrR family transcriptional regulator
MLEANKKKLIEAVTEPFADAVIELIQIARDQPDQPLEDLRPIIREGFEQKVEESFGKLNDHLVQLAFGICEAAAQVLEQQDILSGAKAGVILRALTKEDLADIFKE